MALRTRTQWWGVVLDAPDARELAHFYARLLGWRIFNEADDWADLAPSEDAGYNLAFATEANYVRPVWPTEEGKPQMSMHALRETGLPHPGSRPAAPREYAP